MCHVQYRMLHGYVMLFGIVWRRTMQYQVPLRCIVTFNFLMYFIVPYFMSSQVRSELKDTNKVLQKERAMKLRQN